jgi:hypothetical protein
LCDDGCVILIPRPVARPVVARDVPRMSGRIRLQYKNRKPWTIARTGVMIAVLLAILRADCADRLREAPHA